MPASPVLVVCLCLLVESPAWAQTGTEEHKDSIRSVEAGIPIAKTDFKSVDAYIASQPEEAQGVLKRVRTIIQKALPRAEEVISYQIPAYKLHGRTVIYFAGFKKHYSLYPVSDRMVTAFGDKFAPYERSGRGTIRFPIDKPIPVRLIGSIARFRAKEVADRQRESIR